MIERAAILFAIGVAFSAVLGLVLYVFGVLEEFYDIANRRTRPGAIHPLRVLLVLIVVALSWSVFLLALRIADYVSNALSSEHISNVDVFLVYIPMLAISFFFNRKSIARRYK
jgi:hypothetical protein